MKHLFIVNPTAGRTDSSAAVAAAVEKAFADREEDYEIYTTCAPMDACRKVEEAAAHCDALRVYACGGDGTLNECVCGTVGRTNVAVTHFPTGTGNDFIKFFGAEAARFRNLNELLDGEVRRLDVIDCNGRYTLNICSVGIDARIGADVHKYSSLPLIGGATGYITSLVVNWLKGTKDRLRVNCDGRDFSGEMSIVCACNGSYYGGSFHPMPEARPDDGVMEVLVIKGVSRLKLPLLVGAYAKGRYADYPELITRISCTELCIEGEKELLAGVDGEVTHGRSIRMRLCPGALNFIVPVNLTYFSGRREKSRV